MDASWEVDPGNQQEDRAPAHQGGLEDYYAARPAEGRSGWGRPAEEQGAAGSKRDQPRRSGRQAPEDQQRGLEALTRPSQYDYLRKKKGRAQEAGSGQKHEEQGNWARAQENAGWQEWHMSRDDYGALSKGGKEVPTDEGTGTPDADDVYQVAWVATKEDVPEDDRDYLTSNSNHSMEVRNS